MTDSNQDEEISSKKKHIWLKKTPVRLVSDQFQEPKNKKK